MSDLFNTPSPDNSKGRFSLSGLKSIFLIPAALLLAACASIGNPSGGPRDEEAPRFLHSNPTPEAINFNGSELNIYFDEIVNVKDAFSKVIMSPPSGQVPRVSAIGRRINVKFQDTLRANTTYTIDFGNAIRDNNEGNPLENFSFTFSTGPERDTLGVSGMVLSAEDLEPLQGGLVGLHRNHADSAFRSLPFDYVARTDDRGRFALRGLAPGSYRIFALTDPDNNLRYSSPEEELAFMDIDIVPSVDWTVVTDTVWNLKEMKPDTTVERRKKLLLPNDLLLRSFISKFKQQYLAKYERIDSTRLTFLFNSPALTPATYSIVGAPRLKDWAIEERSPTNDTVTLWLRNRSLVAADTLRVALNFERTDSVMKLRPTTDTLRFTVDRRLLKKEAEKKEAEKKKLKKKDGEDEADSVVEQEFLNVNMLSSSQQEIYLPLLFETDTPLERLSPEAFHLEQKRDTVWIPVKMSAPTMPDSLRPRNFRIDHPWEFETQYRLTIDSLAMEGIYGLPTRPIVHEFKTRAENDYSALTMNITGAEPGTPLFVQVLTSDKPVATARVENGKAVFPYLQPGKYYLRIYEDWNGNGVFDPGEYDEHRQPDLVYYYPKRISLKKNWSKEETWDPWATAVDLQKPEAIRQKRPEQLQNRRTQTSKPTEDEEEE